VRRYTERNCGRCNHEEAAARAEKHLAGAEDEDVFVVTLHTLGNSKENAPA